MLFFHLESTVSTGTTCGSGSNKELSLTPGEALSCALHVRAGDSTGFIICPAQIPQRPILVHALSSTRAWFQSFRIISHCTTPACAVGFRGATPILVLHATPPPSTSRLILRRFAALLRPFSLSIYIYTRSHLDAVLTSLVVPEQGARELPVTPIAAQQGHAAYATTAFANHSRPVPEGSGGINRTPPGSLAHGYAHAQVPQSEAHLHPELRSGHEAPAPAPVYTTIPNMIPPGASQTAVMSGPLQAVAPAVGGVDPDEGPDGRKAKRELSQSKRAAQNRAAQVSRRRPFS